MSHDPALGDGRLPNIDAVLQVRESEVLTPGSGSMRAIDVTPMGGIAIRVLPDRGLDIGAAWFAGVPLAWVSQVGEVGPLQDPQGMEWGEAFGGGLVVTCGLRNVGMPSEGHGLHGTYSHLSATQVATDRSPDENTVTIRGVIDDATDEHHFRLDRTIVTHDGCGLVELTDVTENLGSEPEPAPILYHVNLGHPLWSGDAELDIDARDTIPRDVDSEASMTSWRRPHPIEVSPERVLEHEFATDATGWGGATVANERLGIRLSIRWRAAELPRLHQWVDPNPGMNVLGIEPSNASTAGRAHDRAEGRLPMLAPGEQRETRIAIEAGRVA